MFVAGVTMAVKRYYLCIYEEVQYMWMSCEGHIDLVIHWEVFDINIIINQLTRRKFLKDLFYYWNKNFVKNLRSSDHVSIASYLGNIHYTHVGCRRRRRRLHTMTCGTRYWRSPLSSVNICAVNTRSNRARTSNPSASVNKIPNIGSLISTAGVRAASSPPHLHLHPGWRLICIYICIYMRTFRVQYDKFLVMFN